MGAFIPIAAIGALAAAGVLLVVAGAGKNKTPEERVEEDKEQMDFLHEWSNRTRK